MVWNWFLSLPIGLSGLLLAVAGFAAIWIFATIMSKMPWRKCVLHKYVYGRFHAPGGANQTTTRRCVCCNKCWILLNAESETFNLKWAKIPKGNDEAFDFLFNEFRGAFPHDADDMSHHTPSGIHYHGFVDDHDNGDIICRYPNPALSVMHASLQASIQAGANLQDSSQKNQIKTETEKQPDLESGLKISRWDEI